MQQRDVRGEAENRIKELKCDLRIDRTSCHRFLTNQFRLFLHAAAFVLFNALGKLLSGTQWGKAQVATLQRDLIKLGVRSKADRPENLATFRFCLAEFSGT